jgi:rare lipoprotein A
MNSKKIFTSFTTGVICLLMTISAFAITPEFGKATYYNDKYEGRKTASGELYNKALYTCAHKTHKFGTMLRVTRLDDNRTVDVRVNDRGPYAEGFVIDVSRAAAEEIGLDKAGSLKVKVEVIEKEAEAAPTPAPTPATTPKPAPKTEPTVKTQKNTVATAPAAQSQPNVLPELVKSKATSPLAAPKAPKAPAKETVTVAPKLSLLENATYKIDVAKAETTGFAVQLYSLSSIEAAFSEASKLQASYKGKTLLQTASDGSCKVLIGPYKTRKEAEVAQKAATKKHPKCYIVNLDQDNDKTK